MVRPNPHRIRIMPVQVAANVSESARNVLHIYRMAFIEGVDYAAGHVRRNTLVHSCGWRSIHGASRPTYFY